MSQPPQQPSQHASTRPGQFQQPSSQDPFQQPGWMAGQQQRPFAQSVGQQGQFGQPAQPQTSGIQGPAGAGWQSSIQPAPSAPPTGPAQTLGSYQPQATPAQLWPTGGFQPQGAISPGSQGHVPTSQGPSAPQEVAAGGMQPHRGFEESVPNEVAALASNLDRLETLTQWAADRAAERGRGNVARICNDLTDVARIQKELTVRQSPAARTVGRSASEVIQNAVTELQPFLDEPGVTQAVFEAQQAVSAINDALARLPGPATGGSQVQPYQQMWP